MPKSSPKINMLPLKNCRFVLPVFGACLALLGSLFSIYFEDLMNYGLENSLVISPNTRIFEMWKQPPFDLLLDVYFFNWTNPEDFTDPSTKPILQELGPYRFMEKPDKVDIKWHPENASVTYRKKSHFYFIDEGSKGTLLDEITAVNAVAVTVGSKSKAYSSMRRTLIDIALNVYPELTLTKTVDEWLFRGYEDVLLDVANMLPSSISDVNLPFDRIGYSYSRNGSSQYTGIYNVHTGADDIRNLGKLHTWNYRNSSKYFPKQCSQIRASTGEFQDLYLKKNGSVDLFVSDLCRTITLDYQEAVEYEELVGYKYLGGLRAMDNGTLYPENTCYCNGQCVPSGVMNISACWFDAPVFMSYPHYYSADPIYANQVVGMKPDKEKHEMYIVLEPRTGFALDLAVRFQINLQVEPLPHLNMFQNVPKMLFPLFWFEVRTSIPPDFITEFKAFAKYVWYGQIFGVCCAISGLLILLWHFVRHWRYSFIRQNEMAYMEGKEEKRLTAKEANLVKQEMSPVLRRSKVLPNTICLEMNDQNEPFCNSAG